MPTYDYECLDCGHKFEEFQKISDKPLKTCPKCKKRKVKRLIGIGQRAIFKGTGFYETDYVKKSGDKPEEKPSASSDSKPETKAAGKKDSKPAAKKNDKKSGKKD